MTSPVHDSNIELRSLPHTSSTYTSDPKQLAVLAKKVGEVADTRLKDLNNENYNLLDSVIRKRLAKINGPFEETSPSNRSKPENEPSGLQVRQKK